MKEQDNYDLQVDIARRIFLEYDQEQLLEKFSLEADPAWIYLTYLQTPCRICRKTGRIDQYRQDAWEECRDYSRVMTIYDLLCFSKEKPVLTGQWCTVGTFIVAGITDTGSFTGKYAQRFDRRPDALGAACEALGGIAQPPMAGADLTVLFWVTPFFPVLLQFWRSDEEFPPKLLLLWDRNADRFLHFETTFYLQGDLVSQIWEKLKQ